MENKNMKLELKKIFYMHILITRKLSQYKKLFYRDVQNTRIMVFEKPARIS